MLAHNRQWAAIVALTCAIALFIALALVVPGRWAVAAGLSQGNAQTVDIRDEECSFWLDYDGDGEGNQPFDTGADAYLPQHTPVVGGCAFSLDAKETATLIVESELDDWSAEVDLKRAPGSSQVVTLHPARNDVSDISGGMTVGFRLWGKTPRSIKNRELEEGYHHEVQIPRNFRLFEITLATNSGGEERIAEESNSASNAYIYASELIASGDSNTTLASELLDEGYPQIAARVHKLGEDSNGSGPGGWWQWAAIATWVGALFVAIVAVALLMMNRQPSATRSRTQGSRL